MMMCKPATCITIASKHRSSHDIYKFLLIVSDIGMLIILEICVINIDVQPVFCVQHKPY